MSRDKKTSLLNESVVRRFMKLAEIGPTLSSNFVREAFEDEEEDFGEEAVEEPAPEMPPEPEAVEAEVGATVELNVEKLVSDIADAIEASTAEQGSPVSLSVEPGGEGLDPEAGMEPEMDLEPEPEMEPELPEEEEELPPGMRYEGNIKKGDAGLAKQGPNKDNTATDANPGPHKLKGASTPAGSLAEGGDEEELEEAEIDLIDDESLVAEVARRVAARLIKEKRKRSK
tara:strand:+ start:1068 stop:1754 length:687 start_codon:yes stop_codon:yes gene_type:complete